jgi:hypothetical protein
VVKDRATLKFRCAATPARHARRRTVTSAGPCRAGRYRPSYRTMKRSPRPRSIRRSRRSLRRSPAGLPRYTSEGYLRMCPRRLRPHHPDADRSRPGILLRAVRAGIGTGDERHDYEPVTLYMVKHRFSPEALPPSLRKASAENVPVIVKRSAEHRRTLTKINPLFWHIHPQADSRFGEWMWRSLTFKDR